ncbi:MAG: hypothetical protein FP816_18745 [Desulfobacteraceae bacterium]|nr:hypothetical protein [Desulfobacteraceae bacterium]
MANRMAKRAKIFVLSGLGLFLWACTTTTVQEIATDKTGYLTTDFTPQVLSPDILKKLPIEMEGVGFERLKITYEVSSEQTDGKKESWKSVATLTDKGNGLVQEISELTSNDIPYRLYYGLSYRGMVDLKWQWVPLRGHIPGQIHEVKDIGRFDVIPSAMDQGFVFDVTMGTVSKIAGTASYQKQCRTLHTLPAGDLHPGLPGQAMEIECKVLINNNVQTITRFMLLLEYGFAIPVEHKTSLKITTFRVIDVEG